MVKWKNHTDRHFHLSYSLWLLEVELYCPRYAILSDKEREKFWFGRATAHA
jgi:hypothetical protein